MRFHQKYSVVGQFLETRVEKLAMDILRLMKDCRAGAFPPDALIGSFCSLYEASAESDVKKVAEQSLHWLEENGLIEKMEFMTFDKKTVHDYVITMKGWSVKQFETSEEYFVQARHIAGLTFGLERELDNVQRNCSSETLSDGLKEWQEKAQSLIRDHSERDDLSAMLEKITVHSENEYFELIEDWRKMRDILHEITSAVSYVAPPIASVGKLSPSQFAERVRKLSLKWDGFTYKGSRVSEESIIGWLGQFDGADQTLMLMILERMLLVSVSRARDLMRVISKKIKERLQNKQPNLLVSAFGTPDKSGSHCARLFRQENDIEVEVSSIDEIGKRLLSQKYDALVFIEDVIGSGRDVCSLLDQLEQSIGSLLKEKKVPVLIFSICALESGLACGTERAKRASFETDVKTFYAFQPCFSKEANVFDSDENRTAAQSIAEALGKELREDKPLGFEGSQMLVVFHDNCPNNNLPIIYAVPDEKSSNKKWFPLFPRTGAKPRQRD